MDAVLSIPSLGRQFSDVLPIPFISRQLRSRQVAKAPDFSALVAGSAYVGLEIDSVAPTKTSDARPTTTLLDLPADVLYLVSDHLDTASTHSLSLSCRGLYGIGLPQTQRKLTQRDQQKLLTLLERDPIADGRFYCHRCNKLHPFDQESRPELEDGDNINAFPAKCGLRDVFAPTGNSFGFSYHHARLVMNRHIYGPSHGIPLENVCVNHNAQRGDIQIACTTAAAIIQNELFLHRTYSFVVSNAGAAEFRKCVGHRDFRLCEHMPLFRNSSVYHQGIPELQTRPRAAKSGDEFLKCCKAPGSCGLCLMDYDISINKIDGSDNWQIRINVYHQLGECRSPEDWKWARFTERSRPHLFLPNRPNRRGSGFSPGSIKRTWTAASNGQIPCVMAGENGVEAHPKRQSV